MPAFNVVRFRVKPGCEGEFLDAHRHILDEWPGLRRASLVKTGEGTYCLVAEWEDIEAVGKARPRMIATLDTFRGLLEDLGEGKGITDAVSGSVVLQLG